jgi:hypothetical protein
LKKVWDDGNNSTPSTDILRAHALLLDIDIINQWIKFLGAQFGRAVGNHLVIHPPLERRLKDMLDTQLEFIKLFIALCDKLEARAELIDDRHLQKTGARNWHQNRGLATKQKVECFKYLSAGSAQQSIFRIKEVFKEIKDELTTATFDPVHLPKIAPLNNLLEEVRKILPAMREEFELAPQSVDSYFSPSKEGCLYQLRPTKRSFRFAKDWKIGYYVAHSGSLYRYKLPLGDMLEYHEEIDLAAYDISCIVHEETTCFLANDSWWLLLEHKSGNHEIKLKAPPNALDRGLLSEKKYVEAWVKDLKRLAVSAHASAVKRKALFQTLCENNGLAADGDESDMRNRLKYGLDWDDRRVETAICTLIDAGEIEDGGGKGEEQPVPDHFDIVCRKCGNIFSLEKVETHDSTKCGGAANAMGSNTLEKIQLPGRAGPDEFSDDSEEGSEDSDSDDDEVVEWETFIGFIEKSAAEQQKMARELGLDVEVLRASAQKLAAKEVDKVQLLHQRVVVALHQRLEGLKRRREKLLQSRLKQPLTQDRVAMVDCMRANC